MRLYLGLALVLAACSTSPPNTDISGDWFGGYSDSARYVSRAEWGFRFAEEQSVLSGVVAYDIGFQIDGVSGIDRLNGWHRADTVDVSFFPYEGEPSLRTSQQGFRGILVPDEHIIRGYFWWVNPDSGDRVFKQDITLERGSMSSRMTSTTKEDLARLGY